MLPNNGFTSRKKDKVRSCVNFQSAHLEPHCLHCPHAMLPKSMLPMPPQKLQFFEWPCRNVFLKHTGEVQNLNLPTLLQAYSEKKQLHHALINTYGWRSLENAANEPESVTGFLRITSDKVNTILALSGHHGPFFEPLAKDRGSCVVEWVSQGPHENDDEYLLVTVSSTLQPGPASHTAVKARAGLDTDYRKAVYRPSSADRPRLWEAKGIPRDWNAGKLVEWLETCGWKDVNLEAQPSRHRGWIYRARHDDPAHCYAYDIGSNHTIGISQHFRHAKAPSLLKLLDVHFKVDLPNPGSLLHSRRTSPCPMKSRLTTPTWTKLPKRMNKRKIRKPNVPPTKVLALKRNGQRPYLQVKLTNTKFSISVDLVTALIVQLLLLMPCRTRGQLTRQSPNQNNLAPHFAPKLPVILQGTTTSKKAFVSMTSGLPPQRVVLCHKTMRSVWKHALDRVDGLMDLAGLVTISTRLRRNLLIWKWNDDQKRYIKTALIVPHEDHPDAIQQARAYPPLPLLLKQSHYMTLKPDANNPFPMTWNVPPSNVTFDARLHRGGGKSIQSWLPESSVGSWLPPSSSKQKSVKASSSAKTAKASLPTNAISNMTKHTSVKSIRIAKPCKSVPKLTFKKKQKQYNKRPHSWNCPECHTSFHGTYGSVMGSRLHHWRSRHRDKPVETLFNPKPLPYAVSHQLPTDQQDWKCPLCTAALPFLPRYDRQKAIQQHATECHPGHTPYTLRNLNLKGLKKPGVAEAQRKKFEKLRNKKFKYHRLVTVETPERAAKKRGCQHLHYCKVCLQALSAGLDLYKITCKQHLFKQRTKEQRYCARKMLWWRNLLDKQPKHAANLAAAVGKSFDEITAIFAKNWYSTRVVHHSISPHSWTPDLTEHGDIHPNPGPPDRSFLLWSCNCGRGAGSWEAFALAMSEKIDILAIQEDALTPTERESFVRHVTRHNYRIFEGWSRMRNKRAWGGALILVHNSLRCRQLQSYSYDDGQAVTIMVEGIALSCIYQPPGEIRLPVACHLYESLHLTPKGTPWVCVGDFNDIPQENVFLIDETFPELCACFVTDSQGQAVPSRWRGNRCLDYAITNAAEHLSAITFSTEAIADHKIFQCNVKLLNHRRNTWPYRLTKHANLCEPDTCSPAAWDEYCVSFLSSRDHPVPPQQVDQKSINHYWSEVSCFYEEMLKFAKRQSSPADCRFPDQLAKGKIVLKQHLPSHGKLDHANDTFRIRKWETFLLSCKKHKNLTPWERRIPQSSSALWKIFVDLSFSRQVKACTPMPRTSKSNLTMTDKLSAAVVSTIGKLSCTHQLKPATITKCKLLLW